MHRIALVSAPFVAITLLACNGGEPVNGAPPPEEPNGEVYQAEDHAYRVVEVVTGLEHPWGLAFLPDGDMLVTERPGRVRLIRDGELLPDELAGAPEVEAGGQGGMLDVVLHPDFATNQFVYFSYSKAVEGGRTTAVAWARFEGDAFQDLEDVFVADAVAGGGQHFGSRIAFDPDGFMFVSVGERGQQEPAQNVSDHIGTTVRLNDDGSAPDDNPFVDEEGALPEIYTYGHRNVQGMAVHLETGAVWQNEHGPAGGDEINLIEAGANYGWPDVNFGDGYDGTPIPDPEPDGEYTLPLLDWTPSIAPSGMAFYTGDAFPAWQGDTFHGALAFQHLRRVVFDGTDPVHQEELLTELDARIRDVRDGPDGFLYVLTDASDGALLRIEPAD